MNYEWTPRDVAAILQQPIPHWGEDRTVYFDKVIGEADLYCGCAIGKLACFVHPPEEGEVYRVYSAVKRDLCEKPALIPEEAVDLLDRLHNHGVSNLRLAWLLQEYTDWDTALERLSQAWTDLVEEPLVAMP